MPHGTLCATLLAEATRENIAQLRFIDEKHPQLQKFARTGAILSGEAAENIASGCELLLETLKNWQERLAFPRLSFYGMICEDVDGIVAATRCKSNAVQLDNTAMKRILSSRW